MSEKSREFSVFSMLKEVIWALLLAVLSFVYAVIMLLIVTFIFNSIIDLSFSGILVISTVVSFCAFLFFLIKSIIKHRKAQ